MFIYSIFISCMYINASVALSFSGIGFKILNSDGILNFEIEITRARRLTSTKLFVVIKWSKCKCSRSTKFHFIWELSHAAFNGI